MWIKRQPTAVAMQAAVLCMRWTPARKVMHRASSATHWFTSSFWWSFSRTRLHRQYVARDCAVLYIDKRIHILQSDSLIENPIALSSPF